MKGPKGHCDLSTPHSIHPITPINTGLGETAAESIQLGAMTRGSRPAAATTEHLKASNNAGPLSCETRMDMAEKMRDTA